MQIKCSRKHTKLLIVLPQGTTVRLGKVRKDFLYIFIILEKVPIVHFMISKFYHKNSMIHTVIDTSIVSELGRWGQLSLAERQSRSRSDEHRGNALMADGKQEQRHRFRPEKV